MKGVNASKPPIKFVVPDSREGWVESLRLLLEAHFKGVSRPEFDYSIIRPRGTPIKGEWSSERVGHNFKRMCGLLQSSLLVWVPCFRSRAIAIATADFVPIVSVRQIWVQVLAAMRLVQTCCAACTMTWRAHWRHWRASRSLLLPSWIS